MCCVGFICGVEIVVHEDVVEGDGDVELLPVFLLGAEKLYVYICDIF